MKIWIRKPNLGKRIKARTTSKIKRAVKGSINPFYGRKGMGWIKNPEKALYNKIYKKVTISIDDVVENVTDDKPIEPPKTIFGVIGLLVKLAFLIWCLYCLIWIMYKIIVM